MADTTPLDAWLKDFPRDEVEGRIRVLESELSQLKNALTLHTALQASNGAAATTMTESAEPPNRPEAVRTIFRRNGNHPLPPGAIKEAMLENGWLRDDEAALKRFYGTLSTMNKRGHLLRLADKRYMLPQESLGGDDV